MRAGFRPAINWLHTWSGLIVGWLLFAMFVTGACGYYRHEITLWMTPELHGLAREPVPGDAATDRAVAWLEVHASNASQWTIDLPDERSPALEVGWSSGKGARGSALLDPRDGQTLAIPPRDTQGGTFLYRLHSDLHFMPPILGRVIASLAGVVLLIALVSGIITHRRLLLDLFKFRPNRGWRSWLDAHNLTSVLALPFHLAITYSGLVIVMILLMPWGVQAAYQKGGLGAFARDAFPPEVRVGGEPARTLGTPLSALVARASSHWAGAAVGEITIDRPEDGHAIVQLDQVARGALAFRRPALVFDGATGLELARFNESLSPVAATHNGIFGFHVGRFAGPIVRLTLFLLGLVGAGMIGTGLVLWTSRRRAHHLRHASLAGIPARLLAVIERLNCGIMAGLPLAIAVYFSANRLLPVELSGRSEREIDALFWAWGVAILLAMIAPARHRWSLLLSLGAMTFVALPVLSAILTDSGLAHTLISGPGPVAGVEIGFLAIALGLGAAAAWTHGSARPSGLLRNSPTSEP